MDTTMNFKGKHVVSIKDFSKNEIEYVMAVAEKMVPYAKGEMHCEALKGKILGTMFFEPSTRTRLSFETAMRRLDGGLIGFEDQRSSSITKGETLADTISVVSTYADVLVIRHPLEGSARLASRFSKVPIINGGDGAGQHPTQTMLDLFTIKQEKGDIEGKHVVLVGDLKYGRTVHSLAYALAMFGARLSFVSPPELTMPDEVINDVEALGITPRLSNDLESVIGDADVLYVSRIQKERFPDVEEYSKVSGTYRVDAEIMKKAKGNLIIMHPLPRVDEISPELDDTPHAVYFKQAFNGIPVRMALLSLVLGVEVK